MLDLDTSAARPARVAEPPVRAVASEPEPDLAILRRLEGTERLAALGNALYGGNYNIVAMLEFEGATTAAAIQRAIEHVQATHEYLQVEVVQEPGTRGHWALRRSLEVPVLEVIDVARAEHWKEVWNRFAETPFETLPWRVAWIRPRGERVSRLVVSFHHAISDAMSLVLFFDAVLAALHRAATGRHEPLVVQRIVPTVHRYVRARWPFGAIARIAYHRYLGKLRTVPFDRKDHVDLDERRWRSLFRTIERDQVERLAARCRAECLTIGNLLSAAMILEMAERVRAREGAVAFDVALCTSIDMRRHEPTIDRKQMGLLVTAIHSFFRPSADDTIWSVARRASQQVQRSIDRGEHRDIANLHRLLGPAAAKRLVRENQGRPADGALLVSNSGRLEGLAHGPFRATAMFATAAQAAWGCTMLLSVSTVQGRMCLHLGHPSPVISNVAGDSFFDGVMRRVLSVDVPAEIEPRAETFA